MPRQYLELKAISCGNEIVAERELFDLTFDLTGAGKETLDIGGENTTRWKMHPQRLPAIVQQQSTGSFCDRVLSGRFESSRFKSQAGIVIRAGQTELDINPEDKTSIVVRIL
jgi:hypothetical protein